MNENSWSTYLTSLLQTYSTLATLFIAVLLIKLQYLSNKIEGIISEIAEIFYFNGEYEAISNIILDSKKNSIANIFKEIKNMVIGREEYFSTIKYKMSSKYLLYLIDRGNSDHKQYRKIVFFIKCFFSISAIIIITTASMIPFFSYFNEFSISNIWLICTIVLFSIFVFFIIVILKFFN
jgi:hypothetical protein